MAKVGVIMPTHGLSRHLAVAVKSVVQQSHQDWTLNIVCDGAAEETVKLAERLASHDTRIRTARQARAGVAARPPTSSRSSITTTDGFPERWPR